MISDFTTKNKKPGKKGLKMIRKNKIREKNRKIQGSKKSSSKNCLGAKTNGFQMKMMSMTTTQRQIKMMFQKIKKNFKVILNSLSLLIHRKLEQINSPKLPKKKVFYDLPE